MHRRVLSLYLPMWPIDRMRRRAGSGRSSAQHHSRSNRSAEPHRDRHRDPHHRRHHQRDGEEAILLVRVIASREEVVLGCECAIAHGVKPGMSVAHAKALLGGCVVHKWLHDPEADAAALERLAAWATRFAPLVMADPDHPLRPVLQKAHPSE